MNAQIFALALLVLLVGAEARRPRPNSCPAVDGEDVTILRNVDDCSSFWICSNGTPYLFECPANLQYNAALRVCDWPENVRCRDGGNRPPGKPSGSGQGNRPPGRPNRPGRPNGERDIETEE